MSAKCQRVQFFIFLIRVFVISTTRQVHGTLIQHAHRMQNAIVSFSLSALSASNFEHHFARSSLEGFLPAKSFDRLRLYLA